VAEGPSDAGGASAGAEAPIPQQGLRDRLATTSAAILGCGGLGSNCAAMLVRSGVLDLTLVDFDEVEADNLNRQLFFADQIGAPKVEALAHTLRRIDPDVRLRLVQDRITEANLFDLVAGADVVVEAVDGAETKALILAVCARDLPDVPVVAASGLAGHASANLIETVRLGENLWVTGDLETDVREGHALVASRVMVAAAHQAHAAIRVLLGLDPV
jgi:sulfur carrier protein ThiS adenylyltransferase